MKKRTKFITAAMSACMFFAAAKLFAEPQFVKLEQNEVKELQKLKYSYFDEVCSNHGRTGFKAEIGKDIGSYDFVCKIEYLDSKKIEYYKIEDLSDKYFYGYNFYLDINDTIVVSGVNKINWFEGVEKSAFFSPCGNSPVFAELQEDALNEQFAFCSVNAIGGASWGYRTPGKVIAYSRTPAKISFNGKLNYFVRISGDKTHQYNWISADKLKLSEKEILALPLEDVDALCFNKLQNGEWYEIPANRVVVLDTLSAGYFIDRDFLELQPGSVLFAVSKSSNSIITSIPEWGSVSLKGLKKVTFPFGYEQKENAQERVFVCLSDNGSSKIKVYSQPSVKAKILGNLDRARGRKEKKDILFDLVGCSTESQTINGQTSKWYYIDAPIEGKEKIVRGWVFGPEFGGNN